MNTMTSQPRLSLVLTSEEAVSHEYGTTPTKKARTPTTTPEPSRIDAGQELLQRSVQWPSRGTYLQGRRTSDKAAEVAPTCGVRRRGRGRPQPSPRRAQPLP